MTEYDNGDCKDWHPHLTRREYRVRGGGNNLIDGKYIRRLSEKGELYLKMALADCGIYDEHLREPENGDQYYEPVKEQRYFDKLGNEINWWERENSVQYYDETGNEIEMLHEEPDFDSDCDSDEEEDFDWGEHYDLIEYVQYGYSELRVTSIRKLGGH